MPALTLETDDDYKWYVEFRVMDGKANTASVAQCLCFERRPPLVPRLDEFFIINHVNYKVIRVFHEVTRYHHTVKVTGERI